MNISMARRNQHRFLIRTQNIDFDMLFCTHTCVLQELACRLWLENRVNRWEDFDLPTCNSLNGETSP